MFCKNCGKELKEDSMFCEYCGAKVDEGKEPDREPVYEKPFVEADNSASMRMVIGKNTDYYMAQFEKIRNGEKGKMNWASFFLGILHAGYRNVWKEWLKAMRLPLIIGLVSSILSMAMIFTKPILGGIFLIVTMVSSVWILAAQILFAKRFHQIYLEHVTRKIARNDQRKDPSIGRMALTWLIVAIIYGGLSSILAAGLLGGMLGNLDAADTADYTLSDEEWSDFPEVKEEEEPIPEILDETVPADEYETEETPIVTKDNYAIWEQSWQRRRGPAASIEIWTADENGIVFAGGIGVSGYLAYVDMRDCVAEWAVPGQSAYYDDPSSGYGMEFIYEDSTLIVNETSSNPAGINLSGIYVSEEEAVYPDCEYVFPDSGRYEVYETECEGLTALECRIAKNEIYARYGRRFKDEQLQNYFDSCSWYSGNIEPDDFPEDLLTDIELANLQIISSYESAMGF